MHLSDVRQKDKDRAIIEAAMARSGVTPVEVPACGRSADFHTFMVLPGSIDHDANHRAHARKGN